MTHNPNVRFNGQLTLWAQERHHYAVNFGLRYATKFAHSTFKRAMEVCAIETLAEIDAEFEREFEAQAPYSVLINSDNYSKREHFATYREAVAYAKGKRRAGWLRHEIDVQSKWDGSINVAL